MVLNKVGLGRHQPVISSALRVSKPQAFAQVRTPNSRLGMGRSVNSKHEPGPKRSVQRPVTLLSPLGSQARVSKLDVPYLRAKLNIQQVEVCFLRCGILLAKIKTFPSLRRRFCHLQLQSESSFDFFVLRFIQSFVFFEQTILRFLNRLIFLFISVIIKYITVGRLRAF